jgi:hypothetical protein
MRACLVLLVAVALPACKGASDDGAFVPTPRSSGVPQAATSARLPGAATALASGVPARQRQVEDAGKINVVLLSAKDRFERCHARSPAAASAGTVELTLSVDASGKVRSTSTTTTLWSSDVADCIEREVRGLVFPELTAPITVVVPLELGFARPPTHL